MKYDMKKQQRINYPASKKIYIKGKIHDIQVGMRSVTLLDTITMENGKKQVEPNNPVILYDTSGAYSNPDIPIDITKGLVRLRQEWIEKRNDTELLPSFSSNYCKERLSDSSLNKIRFPLTNLPRKAKSGNAITQMYYAC